MPRLAFLVVSVVAFLGCNESNPAFCNNPKNAGIDGCPAGGTGGTCGSAADCTMANFPACDKPLNGGSCVQCTADDHKLCTGGTPRCEADTCVVCVDDGDCGGTGVCLPDGSCADTSKIIHAVSSGGSGMGATCGGLGAGNPCTLDIALLIAGTNNRNIIRLDDAGPYKSLLNNFTVNSDTSIGLILDARGAALHPNGDGAILTVNDRKGLTILGGVIEKATGTKGDGIQCTGAMARLTLLGTTLQMNTESGLDTTDCTVTVSKASIRDNSQNGGTPFAGIEVSKGSITVSQSQIINNRGGGLIVGGNGIFTLVGNVFLNNGDSGGSAGGVAIMTNVVGNRLEFNTFVGNKSQNGVGPGIQCTAAAGFTAKNNIVWANTSSSGNQVGGACLHTYSDIGPTGAISDPTNLNSDPKFTSTTDLSVTSASPVKGKAAPDADLRDIAAKDMNGKPRTAPADLGAYVVPAM